MFVKDRSCDQETSLDPVEVWIVEEIKRLRLAESEK